MRRVSRRLRAVASVAATTVPLLWSALPGAASAAASRSPSTADPGPVALPVIPSVLAPGQPCTGASPTQVHAQPWTVRALSLPRAWQLTRGSGVTVAMVDTGVATDVPALAGRVTAAGDAGHDCVGHGSFAAGLIAGGVDDAGGGGVAPQARILAVRGTGPRGGTTPGAVATGIRSAVEGGARIVYVGAALTTGKDELTAAVAYATSKDALVVAPAAPDVAPAPAGAATPDTTARPYYPAFIPQVVAVEDYGPDGSRPKGAPDVFAADLAAPGDAVVSVGPKGPGRFIGSGSSLAAASAAGAAALVRAYQPLLTAAQVERRLVATAYPAATPILDTYAAVASVSSTVTGTPPEPAASVRMPGHVSSAPRNRALIIAAVGGGLLALAVAAAAVAPLGRARHWRPAGDETG
ncbi:MAG: putative secreted in-like serine protease [Streptosporangiaceae bacterium]|nr:putative secreted in-like serine protease [Streptosporangiaceae bacterium]